MDDSLNKSDSSAHTLTVAKGGAIALFGTSAGHLFGFLYILGIARCFGDVRLGEYLLAFNIGRILTSLCALGLEQAIVRYVAAHVGAHEHAQARGLVQLALRTGGVSLVAGATVLALFATTIAERIYHQPGLTGLLFGFALTVPLRGMTSLMTAVPQALRRPLPGVLCNETGYWLFCLVLTGGGILLGYGFGSVILGHVLSSLLMTLLALIFYVRNIRRPVFQGPATREPLGPTLRFALPALGIYLSWLIVKGTDVLLLGYFTGVDASGIYGAASQLPLVGMIFIGSLSVIFTPMISDLYNRDEMQELARLFKLTTQWSLAMSLPYYLILLQWPHATLNLYGSEFGEGATSLIILSAGHCFNATTGLAGYLLIMSGRQFTELLNCLLICFSNVILNLLLIPQYGMAGAALATTGAVILIKILRLLQIYRIHGFHPFEWTMGKPMLASGGAVIITALIRTWFDPHTLQNLPAFLTSVSVFSFAYVILLGCMGLSGEERTVLAAFAGKLSMLLGSARKRKDA